MSPFTELGRAPPPFPCSSTTHLFSVLAGRIGAGGDDEDAGSSRAQAATSSHAARIQIVLELDTSILVVRAAGPARARCGYLPGGVVVPGLARRAVNSTGSLELAPSVCM